MSQPAFAERASGLLVPAHLQHVPSGVVPPGAPALSTDPDGRRRVVIPHSDHRVINRAVRLLENNGFAVILRCARKKGDLRSRVCETVLATEGQGTTDPGMGCECSRIHFGR